MTDWPLEFLNFLRHHNVCEKWFEKQVIASKSIPRFIWLPNLPPFVWRQNHTCHMDNVSESQKNAQTFLKANDGYRVGWTNAHVWAIPQSRTVSMHPSYRNGQMMGIDAASVFAVDVLDPRPGDRVLDLCCAPGAKLTVIADRMNHTGALVGVDFSSQRLDVCTGIVKKWRLGSSTLDNDWYFALAQDDGTLFDTIHEENVRWDHHIENMLFSQSREDHEFVASKPRSRITRKIIDRVAESRVSSKSPQSYNKVIVDTQCTHEGSIRHILKHLQSNTDTWNAKVLQELYGEWLQDHKLLRDLQRQLITNGFAKLESGGTLVYSTCSFCKAQNEDIVSWLLDQHPDTTILESISHCNVHEVPANWTPRMKLEAHVPYVTPSPYLDGTVSMNPVQSGTSGLFIARIHKK